MLTIVKRHVFRVLEIRNRRTIKYSALAALLAALGLAVLFALQSAWPHTAMAAHSTAVADELGRRAATVKFQGSATGPIQVPATLPADHQVRTQSQPLPHGWMEAAVSLGNGSFDSEHGELTAEDGGRDAFSFAATGGEHYIIEAESRLDVHDDGDVHYVENYLPDPSILEVVDAEGQQVMGEHDNGGYLTNSARAFFTPEEDGTYYIAAGSGQSDRSGTGHYTISVRQDDHADDWRTNPAISIRPGESITATIDSDVSPDHPGLNSWNWLHWGSTAEPLWGVESLDDMDTIRFAIDRAGTYRLSVSDEGGELVVWSIWEHDGSRFYFSWAGPAGSVELPYQPGTYYAAVGTNYESEGNTGPYTLSLTAVNNEETTSADRH